MKKKLLLFLAILSALICALTISVSATVPDWTETKDLGFAEKTTTDKSTTFDTTSRVMLLDGDTYVTYPTYYIIKGTDTTFTTSSELDFSALNTATEKNFSYASIIKLEVPYGYTISDERAFRTDKGFTSMVYIKLPDSMTTIKAYPFYNNAMLEEIILPSRVDSFDTNQAFLKATNLKSVKLPKGVTEIKTSCFDGCSSLITVTGLDGVTIIGNRAFALTKALESLTFHEGLTTIDYAAFFQSGIKKVVLPSTLTTVGSKAFESCSRVESVVFRGTVIGERMFYDNDSLTSVAFMQPTAIGAEAFYGCANFPQDAKKAGVFFLVGNDYESVVSLATKTSGNANFSNATIASYEEYIEFKTNGTVPEGKTFSNRLLLVYGCNVCQTLYDDHIYSEKFTPVFESGSFISNCALNCTCERNGCGANVTAKVLSPLFTFAGFSKSEYSGAILQSFAINRSVFDDYKEVFSQISFGLLAAADKLDVENADEQSRFNGVLFENGAFKEKVVTVDFTDKVYDIFEMKLTGLGNYQNASVYLCAYVVANGKINYLHNGSVSDTATHFTYNSID